MEAALALPVLCGAGLLLAVLAVPRVPLRGPACAVLCAVALVVAAAGQGRAAWGVLALDPLSAFALIPVALAGLFERRPLATAAAFLAVLAGAPAPLLAALGVLALCHGWRPGAAAGVILLAAALALQGGGSFAALRAAPPEGWHAAALLVAVLAGLGLLFRDVRSAAAPGLAVYLAARLLLDLGGPATPEAWGVPMLLAGAFAAVAGADHAARAPEVGGVLGGLGWQAAGWGLAGLGAAALARGADVLPLAALAAAGVLLHVTAFAAAAGLAGDAAGSIAAETGTLALDRLGGLARAMPGVAAAMLVAGAALAFLPPFAGFAGGWLVLQALLTAPRAGGMAVQLAVAVTVGALGLAAARGWGALLRLGGTALLGRPRTPRAAGATAAPGWPAGLVAGSALCLAIGVLPGLVLRLAAPAQRVLTGAALETGWLAPAYLPLGLACLGGAVLVALLLAARRFPGTQTVPPWEDGFDSPPPYLPFGDPATQPAPATLTPPAWPMRLPTLPAWRLPQLVIPPHAGIAALGAALAVLLLWAAAMQPA